MQKIKRELSGTISLEEYRDLSQDTISDYHYIASGIYVRGLTAQVRRVFIMSEDPDEPNGPNFRSHRIMFYPKGKAFEIEEGDFRFYRECILCPAHPNHLWDIRTGLKVDLLEDYSFAIPKEICMNVTNYYDIARDPAQVAELRGVGI